MKTFFAIVFAALFLGACQSGPSQYVLDMQRYQGASEAELIDALGPPVNSYEVDGVKYLTYSQAKQYAYDNDTSGVGAGAWRGGGGMWVNQSFGNSVSVQTYRCDVFFAIHNSRVDKVGHRGNAC